MPREERTTSMRPKMLRTRDDIVAANEDIYHGNLDGRYPPKQVEQSNTVIKAQIKILFDIPLKMLQVMRDLRKAGVDMDGAESKGTKLLNANPALKNLIDG